VAPGAELDGRAAFVTGAGSGIGRATAGALAALGAAVTVADLDGEAADAAAAAITATGGTARGAAVDVRDRASVEAAADAATEAHGALRAWVNVAGIMRVAKVVDLTEVELDAVMGVNFKGVVFGSQAAARRMVAAGSGGAIVNVASAILDGPQPRMAAYGASKAAVSHFSRTLAMEVGKAGVRVNVVAPGWTRTAMTEAGMADGGNGVDEDAAARLIEAQARFVPMRRVAEPADSAAAVAWLVSDASGFVTGQTIRPHGGITMPW